MSFLVAEWGRGACDETFRTRLSPETLNFTIQWPSTNAFQFWSLLESPTSIESFSHENLVANVFLLPSPVTNLDDCCGKC